MEVGFHRKSVSPSSRRRPHRGDAETEGSIAPSDVSDPFSGGDILAVGGYMDKDNVTGSSHAQRLHSGQKKWEKFSEMPETRLNFVAAFLNGKLYVVVVLSPFDYKEPSQDDTYADPPGHGENAEEEEVTLTFIQGGYDPCESTSGARATKDTFCFDPSDQTWKRGGSMRYARSFHAVCTLEGRLYALGGQDETEEVLDSAEVYDPAADRWSCIASMFYRRVGASAASFKGRVMVVGGYGESSEDEEEPCPVLLSTEWYEPTLNRWTRCGNLRIPRAQACMVAVGSRLYLCGGATRNVCTGVLCSVRDVDKYDCDADQWTHLTDLQIARHNAGATVIDTKIYVVGGVSTDTNQVLQSVECYDTATDKWDTSIPDLPLGAKSLACVVISDV